MQGKISALATRALLRLCHRNSICMVTRLADEYKVECDESFHARLHRRLQRFGGTPFAPPHVVGLSAKVQWEYHSSGVSVLVVGTF
jgi:hypothetical protein